MYLCLLDEYLRRGPQVPHGGAQFIFFHAPDPGRQRKDNSQRHKHGSGRDTRSGNEEQAGGQGGEKQGKIIPPLPPRLRPGSGPRHDVPAASAAVKNAFGLLDHGEAVPEPEDPFEIPHPALALERFFPRARPRGHGDLDRARAGVFCLPDDRPGKKAGGLPYHLTKLRGAHEAEHVTSYDPHGCRRRGISACLPGNIPVPGKLHQFFVKEVHLRLREPMVLISELVGFYPCIGQYLVHIDTGAAALGEPDIGKDDLAVIQGCIGPECFCRGGHGTFRGDK